MKNIDCKVCGNSYYPGFLYRHILKEHGFSKKEYFDKYIEPFEHLCHNPTCNNECCWQDKLFKYTKFCCQSCANRFNMNEQLKLNPNRNNPEKNKQTCMERYGVTSTLHATEYIDQKKQTWIQKYGVDHPMKNNEIRKKSLFTAISNTEAKDEKEYYEIVQSHVKETNLKKYGVENVFQAEFVKDKTKQTLMSRIGYENCMQDPNIKEKVKNTNMKKYGNPFGISKRYNYNGISFDSSWELAYYIWLTDNGIKFEYHPITDFSYTFEGIKHSYNPDFLINNEYIEIKSNYLFEKLLKPNTMENAKYICMVKNNIKILRNNDIKQYLLYIQERYGKDFILKFRNKDKTAL